MYNKNVGKNFCINAHMKTYRVHTSVENLFQLRQECGEIYVRALAAKTITIMANILLFGKIGRLAKNLAMIKKFFGGDIQGHKDKT